MLLFLLPLVSAFWNDTKIPYELPGDMTSQQCNTILSLVSIAENSDTNWSQYYTYIQDIKDGRGYTTNIVGFCTGTGDFYWVVSYLCSFINPIHNLCNYLDALEKLAEKESSSHKGLKGLPALIKTLGADEQYLEATWVGIYHFYWGVAIQAATSNNLTLPVTKGQLYDIALNMGDLSLLKSISVPSPAHFGDEITWLKELQYLWLRQITVVDKTLDDKQPDRALMWKSIVDSGNYQLDLPISVSCYGDDFVLK